MSIEQNKYCHLKKALFIPNGDLYITFHACQTHRTNDKHVTTAYGFENFLDVNLLSLFNS